MPTFIIQILLVYSVGFYLYVVLKRLILFFIKIGYSLTHLEVEFWFFVWHEIFLVMFPYLLRPLRRHPPLYSFSSLEIGTRNLQSLSLENSQKDDLWALRKFWCSPVFSLYLYAGSSLSNLNLTNFFFFTNLPLFDMQATQSQTWPCCHWVSQCSSFEVRYTSIKWSPMCEHPGQYPW